MSWAFTFDDAENEEEALVMDENYSKASKNDSILFLIDASPALRLPPGSAATSLPTYPVSDSSPLSCALQCASITMHNKIMSSQKDKLGIVFLMLKTRRILMILEMSWSYIQWPLQIRKKYWN